MKRFYSTLRTKLFLLILPALTASCAVIKDIPDERVTKIAKTDFRKLSGRFSNYAQVSTGTRETDWSSTFEPISLWSHINGFRHAAAADSPGEQIVTLDFVSERRAVAKLWYKSEVKKTKKIKGRIKDGYFYRRPYFFAVPLVPLFFGYNTYRYRIGMGNDSIVVDYRWNFWGFAIAAGSSGCGTSNSVFKRE